MTKDKKIHGKQYFKGMGISYRNAQNWTRKGRKRKDNRGWEVFIHSFVPQMFIKLLLAPGTDQALGIQDPSRMDRPWNSLKLMSTIALLEEKKRQLIEYY